MKKFKKLLYTLIALTLVASLFTGCSGESGDTQWFLDKRISLAEKYGTLPAEGQVGSLNYSILEKDSYSCRKSQAGYYVDMLEEPGSPYFIVITLGSKEDEDVEIVDLGMDGSTLQILIAKKDSSDKSDSKSSPCCVLKLDSMPDDIVIHDKNGASYKLIED